ncbi:MAG TPA: hypothetical protein VFA21_20605 [Pyrinomonadaceae bacterium]|nr:hypothetical protein [Pyrinomonadaceae bacterium]
MKRLTLKVADAAQLRQEYADRGLTVTVNDPDAQGAVSVDFDDAMNEEGVCFVAARHFPRSYVQAIMAVDFSTAQTLADMKALATQLRNRVAAALRARWEP